MLRLGEMLIFDRFITDAQLEEALQKQRNSGSFLGMILIDLGYINEFTLVDCLKKQEMEKN